MSMSPLPLPQGSLAVPLPGALDSAREQRILIVGMGGLGCAVAWILAQAGARELVLIDEDTVDESNLGRQVLYAPEDVGASKLSCAKRRLLQLGARQVECVEDRLLPQNARHVIAGVDLVIEGADNYATKFLAADAAHLEGKPIVHGAALGWQGTAWAVGALGAPCYRCLFEDLPSGETQNCTSRGVMGPVVGFTGALMADLALGILHAEPRFGTLFAFDGRAARLREVPVGVNSRCPLCNPVPTILDTVDRHYISEASAA
jgi:molybdopterin/thiamine biosynthesis adenylyltransferase